MKNRSLKLYNAENRSYRQLCRVMKELLTVQGGLLIPLALARVIVAGHISSIIVLVYRFQCMRMHAPLSEWYS